MGSHSLLQGIFPTLGLNLCLLYCRQILYHLSHQGSPFRELKYSSVQRAYVAFGHLATPHHKVIYHKGFQGPCSVGVRCFQFMRNEEGYPLEQTLGTIVYQTVFQVPGSLSSVQSLSRVRLFVTPWTAAHQASLSITNSRSLLTLMPIESVMPSNHLILCRPFSSCLQSLVVDKTHKVPDCMELPLKWGLINNKNMHKWTRWFQMA